MRFPLCGGLSIGGLPVKVLDRRHTLDDMLISGASYMPLLAHRILAHGRSAFD